MEYLAHINLEICDKSDSIKYLFKYVYKWHDWVTTLISSDVSNLESNVQTTEIKQYYDYWYLPLCEPMWRHFAFDIHERWPPVQRLTFHLHNHQTITFRNDEMIDVVDKNKNKLTIFWHGRRLIKNILMHDIWHMVNFWNFLFTFKIHKKVIMRQNLKKLNFKASQLLCDTCSW